LRNSLVCGFPNELISSVVGDPSKSKTNSNWLISTSLYTLLSAPGKSGLRLINSPNMHPTDHISTISYVI
jgi:hypothetical protein